MRTALDSNIISALWSNEPTARAVSNKLVEAQTMGALVLSPIAYAELHAHPRVAAKLVREKLAKLDIQIDFDLREPVWDEAANRFSVYADRRRKTAGEFSKRMLADFVIGAHALYQADRLMTTDVQRYRTYFPELVLHSVAE